MQNFEPHLMNGKSQKHLGFTLLEMSIVLVIIAVIIAGSVATLTASVKSSQYNATITTMQAIDTAMLNFKAVNGRLPCPGDLTLPASSPYYGLEAGAGMLASYGNGIGQGWCGNSPTNDTVSINISGTPTTAAITPNANYETYYYSGGPAVVAEGAVPVNALKLPDSYMYDAWGNHIRYAVYVPLTKGNATTSTPIPNAFSISPVNSVYGAITIEDGTYLPSAPVASSIRTSNAVYALISHGKNGEGAYTLAGTARASITMNTLELTNCHANGTTSCNASTGTYASTYVQQLPSYQTDANGNQADDLYYFDDIVTYKQRWQMVTPTDPLPPYIYVVDPLYNRVNIYSSNGIYMNSIGAGYNGITGSPFASGSSNGQFNAPYGVAVDGTGNVWVTDTGNHRVQEFSADGVYIGQFGSSGTAAGKFGTLSPTGIAFDKNGKLWLTDNGNNKIQRCSTAGSCNIYGTSKYNNLFLSGPTGIAVDNSTNCKSTTFCVWVADKGNNRVVTFNGTDGSTATNIPTSLNYFGTTGTGNGQMTSPKGIAIDSRGYVWVTDSGNNRIDEFTYLGGLPYTVVGGATLPFGGGATNYFSLPSTVNTGIPQGLTFDASGNIWASDSGNALVEEFNPTGVNNNSFPVNLLTPTAKIQSTALSNITSTSGMLIATQVINDTTGSAQTYIKANTTLSVVSSQTAATLSQPPTANGTGIPVLISNPPQGIAISNR